MFFNYKITILNLQDTPTNSDGFFVPNPKFLLLTFKISEIQIIIKFCTSKSKIRILRLQIPPTRRDLD